MNHPKYKELSSEELFLMRNEIDRELGERRNKQLAKNELAATVKAGIASRFYTQDEALELGRNADRKGVTR